MNRALMYFCVIYGALCQRLWFSLVVLFIIIITAILTLLLLLLLFFFGQLLLGLELPRLRISVQEG